MGSVNGTMMLPLRASSRSGLTKLNVGHGFYQRHWSMSDNYRRNRFPSNPTMKEILKNPDRHTCGCRFAVSEPQPMTTQALDLCRRWEDHSGRGWQASFP